MAELKTIAIRVSQRLRDELDSVIAIKKTTVNQAGVDALTTWIHDQLADPAVREQIEKGLEEEERALEQRRLALQRLSASTPPPQPAEAKPEAKPDPKPDPKAEPKAEPTLEPDPKADPKAEPKVAPKPTPGATGAAKSTSSTSRRPKPS